MEVTITFDKTPIGWSFDHSSTNTWGEMMTNGSEVSMDWWFEDVAGYPPGPFSTMTATISTTKGASTFVMTKTGQSEFMDVPGTTYKDNKANDWWFCPWLTKYFGKAPDFLYVTITNVESN